MNEIVDVSCTKRKNITARWFCYHTFVSRSKLFVLSEILLAARQIELICFLVTLKCLTFVVRNALIRTFYCQFNQRVAALNTPIYQLTALNTCYTIESIILQLSHGVNA